MMALNFLTVGAYLIGQPHHFHLFTFLTIKKERTYTCL